MASKKILPNVIAQKKYNHARIVLLVMSCVTLFNIVSLFAGGEMMFLFSVEFPYLVATVGYLAEDAAILTVCGAVAGICLFFYFLCWLLSKKRHGWLTAALVFFCVDVLIQVGFYVLAEVPPDLSGILCPAYILFALCSGAKYGKQLKQIPAEETPYAEADADSFADHSVSFRMVDPDVKSRVLLETEYLGRRICYRRTGRTNELAINDRIYDEIDMLFETTHSLTAVVDGHTVSAGYDGNYSYICADGVIVARKRRIF